MSRIGKLPVKVPAEVSVSLDTLGRQIEVNGPKGTLVLKLPASVKVEQSDDSLVIIPKNSSRIARQQYGLARSLVANSVNGVHKGYERQLEIHGVGFRVQINGQKLVFNLGFSHPVEYDLPADVSAQNEANILTLTSIDKQLLGQVAAEIRALKKPEPYKGKGIRYAGEYVRRKVGKAASK